MFSATLSDFKKIKDPPLDFYEKIEIIYLNDAEYCYFFFYCVNDFFKKSQTFLCTS